MRTIRWNAVRLLWVGYDIGCGCRITFLVSLTLGYMQFCDLFTRQMEPLDRFLYAEWLKPLHHFTVKGFLRPFYGPFGSQDDRWRHIGNMPQKLPRRGVNRQLQARAQTSTHRNISGTINPTNQIWRPSSDHIIHSVGGPPLSRSKFNMADGRHLENRYDVMFPFRRLVRFGWNVSAWCTTTRRLRWNTRNPNHK